MTTTLVSLCVSADRNYEDAVAKLDQTRIEWEGRMTDFCKVGVALRLTRDVQKVLQVDMLD